jgi:divinyl protochlorophyllide a 8-vinyl-reductase
VLLAAIARHAWTFAGSGEFNAHVGRCVELTLHHNPLCRGWHSEGPACDFYAATFERLFRALVHPRAQVVEVSCEACGADACRFEVRW